MDLIEKYLGEVGGKHVSKIFVPKKMDTEDFFDMVMKLDKSVHKGGMIKGHREYYLVDYDVAKKLEQKYKLPKSV